MKRFIGKIITYLVCFFFIISLTTGIYSASAQGSAIQVPAITGISPGSVSEDYDEDEPVLIAGDGFNTEGNIRVKFNDIYAEKVYTHTGSDGKMYLEVYLPDDDRLEPGIYNITVINSDNNKQTFYDEFSVIRAADYLVPAEGVRVKYSGSSSEVLETVNRSQDTVLLASRYIERRGLTLDLDELMGDDVLVRKIIFSATRGESIREIDTISRWAEIRLCGIKLDSDYSWEDIELRLGRIEPVLKKSLQQKLAMASIKSEFIEVGGENFTFDQVELSIPFTNSEGYDLKVLRYDEQTRQWHELPCRANLLDNVVEFSSRYPGIFVVVE